MKKSNNILKKDASNRESMGPKIEAVISILKAHPEGQALINDPPNIARALDGETGTRIKV